MSSRFRRRSVTDGAGQQGQSLAELALLLPFLMLVILIGLDFGRVFLGYVSLNNSVRIAANFAAQVPAAWNPSSPNVAAQTQYQQLVTRDAVGINCTLPNPVPAPQFPNGTAIGQPALVEITCRFALLTPVIGNILGNTLNVSASAAFPIKAGVIAGIPVQTAAPPPTPTPTPDPNASPTPTPSIPLCSVPNLTDNNTANAVTEWRDAGFTSQLIFNPLTPPNYNIGSQSLTIGSSQPCTTNMTVTP